MAATSTDPPSTQRASFFLVSKDLTMPATWPGVVHPILRAEAGQSTHPVSSKESLAAVHAAVQTVGMPAINQSHLVIHKPTRANRDRPKGQKCAPSSTRGSRNRGFLMDGSSGNAS